MTVRRRWKASRGFGQIQLPAIARHIEYLDSITPGSLVGLLFFSFSLPPVANFLVYLANMFNFYNFVLAPFLAGCAGMAKKLFAMVAFLAVGYLFLRPQRVPLWPL